MHNAPRQPRENTHMLIARRMFVQRQHNHKLRLVVAPRYRLRQAGDADGRLLDMLRFTVRNGEAKAQPGGEHRFAGPQIGFQLTRVAAAPGQQQIVGHTLNHLLFTAPVAVQRNALRGNQRRVLLGHAELGQQVLDLQRSTALHRLIQQLTAGAAIELRQTRLGRGDRRRAHA